MELPTFGTTGRRLCVAAAAGLAAVALAAPECYKTIDVLPACSMGDGCNADYYCGDEPEVHSNEMVKTTQTNGNRTTTVDLDYLCHVTWMQRNSETLACDVPRICNYTVQGKVASGGLCVGGGGGAGSD